MNDSRATGLAGARAVARGLRSLACPDAPTRLLPAVLAGIGLIDSYFETDSAIGPVFVAYGAHGVSALGRATAATQFVASYARRSGRHLRFTTSPPAALARAVARRLRGGRATIDIDLRALSEFERATLLKTAEVPRGEVRPYAWVAREIGRPGAVRAVGSALGRNPVPLLIPCHRVVRSDGRLGQYVFGEHAKRAVLAAEGLMPARLENDARNGTRFIGSATTRIFCFPTCRNARRITGVHRVSFTSDTAAREAGFRPCAVCRP